MAARRKSSIRFWPAQLIAACAMLHCLNGPEPGDHVGPWPIDPADSAIVAAILDSNGLTSMDIHKVFPSSGKVSFLRFDSLRLPSFKFTSEFSKLDSLLDIDLSNNAISSLLLPDTVRCRHTLVLHLDRNSLDSVPTQLGRLRPIVGVYLDSNRLAAIPPEMMEWGLTGVYVQFNKLCAVPDSIVAWLDTVSVNWTRGQVCP